MSLSDPIGDMLARLKNSQMRNHKKIELPSSKFKAKIAEGGGEPSNAELLQKMSELESQVASLSAALKSKGS